MSNNRSVFIDKEHELSKKLLDFYSTNPYEGKRYYGVTRVLSETKSEEDLAIIEKWKQTVGEVEADRILKESVSIGNSLDQLVERYMTKDPNYIEGATPTAIRLFNQIKRSLDSIDPIGTQIHMYSDKRKIQGYLDCVGMYNGELTMIDFKNSRSRKNQNQYNDYMLQATIYCMLLHEMTGILIKNICIIMAVRNDNVPQIIKASIKDYIPQAKIRLLKFNSR